MSAAFATWRTYLLAAIIAVGLTAAWFVVAALMISVGELAPLAGTGRYEQLYVRLDGEPVIVRLAMSGQTEQVETLDREPTTGDTYQILYPAYIASPVQDRLQSGRSWNNRLASISDGGSPAILWYLVHDGQPNGRVYGIGYHSVTKRVAGYFGREGFSEVLPPRDSWFQVAGTSGLANTVPERAYYEPYWFSQPSMYLLANGQLWQIDTRQHKVAAVERCPDAFAIGWAWRTDDKLPGGDNVRLVNQPNTSSRVLLVRTPEACLLIDPIAGNTKRFPLQPELQSAMLAGYELADGRLLLISQRTLGQREAQLTWLDPTGKVASEKRVTLDSAYTGMNEASTSAAIVAAVAPGTIWQGVFLLVLGQGALFTGEVDTVPAAASHALAIAWPSILLVLAMSAALAWSAYRRQRQFGLPGGVSWAVFVFIFGVAGWIAYRWHRVWPVIEDCPNCRQPAPRDREECTECGAEYPPPALKGTEVFA